MAEKTNKGMNDVKFYKMIFGSVYPLYIQKAERKGRTKEEVDTIIFWLTGYDKKALQKQIEKGNKFEFFFNQAPSFNNNASKITGVICGVRVEEIEDEIIQKVRYLDKLIDELAKGKAMDKILSEYSGPNLPPIPGDSCHLFRGKVARHSGLNLPLSALRPEWVAGHERNAI